MGLDAKGTAATVTFTLLLSVIVISQLFSLEEMIPNSVAPRKGILSAQCLSRLQNLVDTYFAPHRNGITKDMVDDAFSAPEDSDSVVLIQVLENRIYINKSGLRPHEWEHSRLGFILDRLEDYLQRRHLKRDFEFVLVLCSSSCDLH